jgi:hypothetical protein
VSPVERRFLFIGVRRGRWRGFSGGDDWSEELALLTGTWRRFVSLDGFSLVNGDAQSVWRLRWTRYRIDG